MSITIKDIARVAGVSHITVSRALNGDASVRYETKERIRKIAKEMQYVPNYNARNLVLDKSYIVGLFFSTLKLNVRAEFFHQSIIETLKVLKGKYNVVINGIDEYKDYTAINKRNFDGILVISQLERDNAFIKRALEQKIPTVVMNREVKDIDVEANVLVNERQGAYDAARYLLQAGHEKIAIFVGKNNFNSSLCRKKGFFDAMTEAGKKLPTEYIIQGDYTFESGYNGMRTLWNLPDRPTAIFSSNDDMALGALRATAELGIKVPDRISIVGFDDSCYSAFINPPLTTVQRLAEKMSRTGACILLDILENRCERQGLIYIDAPLCIRKSVRHLI